MSGTAKPLVLLGEALGANEVRTQTPFVGAAGIELLRMLNDAGVTQLTAIDRDYIHKFWQTGNPSNIEMIWQLHPELYRTNVFNLHPPGNKIEAFCGPKDTAIQGYPPLLKSKYVQSAFAGELDRLGEELLRVDPNLVIALGNTPLWALCGTTGISKVRGTTMLSDHTVSGFKVLPTYHPAAVLRQWELRPVALADLTKARVEKEYPEIRRTEREIWIEPSLEDIERFINEHIIGCERLAVDIETAGNQITCTGFSPRPEIALVIPFYDRRRKDGNYWPTTELEYAAWLLIRRVLTNANIRKTFQNGLYDIAFNWRSIGIPTFGALHDTMLLHHALQPESLKSLGFLGSVYANESAWKTERKGTKTIKRDE